MFSSSLVKIPTTTTSSRQEDGHGPYYHCTTKRVLCGVVIKLVIGRNFPKKKKDSIVGENINTTSRFWFKNKLTGDEY